MGLPIYQVDAFTAKPFAGNPAGVCILSQPSPDEWMQNIAREMNLAETAFLLKQTDGYGLRWFTPKVEVELCGHATLASAHVLWENGHLDPQDQARFYTKSGLLTAQRQGDWIQMDFPATPIQDAPEPVGLSQALGARAVKTGKSIFDYFVEVEDEKVVRTLHPDFRLLREIPCRGVIVTSRASTDGFDFVSRFFAPQVGIDEDPVTGSAHCCLTPYWSEKFGKIEMMAFQASERGGVVRVTMNGDRVLLGGQAVTIIQGELC